MLVGAFGLMVDIWTNELSASSKRADIRVPIRNMLPIDIRTRGRDAATHDSNRWVVETVGQISDPQRIAVLLLFAERLSLKETAIVMQVPDRTVSAYLSHALQTVSRRLENDTPRRRLTERATACVHERFEGK